MHNTCIKHGRDIKTQNIRLTSILLVRTYCIPKVVRVETGEVSTEKVYMSRRPPPKISLKHEWKRELRSEHAQWSEVGQLSRSFQSNQPILNPIRERSGRPDIRHDADCARWKKNDPFSRDRWKFFPRWTCSFRENGRNRYWKKKKKKKKCQTVLKHVLFM